MKGRKTSMTALTEAIPTKGISDEFYTRVRSILELARTKIVSTVNREMVEAYWLIGREIVEEEQKGKDRAEYGAKLLEGLSERLTKEFGTGFTVANIKNMRQFYLTYPKRYALRSELSWTHYRILMRVEDENARSFYEIECVKNHWSTRELERQINSLLFQRLALSKNKKEVLLLAKRGQELEKGADLVKDPYVLEFLGIPESTVMRESTLEQALIDHLSSFLLELGRGFAFVARQKRITLDGDHFWIDLVFYNTILRCYVLIDLKIGKLMHQDLGQMQMYVNYYQRELMNEGDSPPIGIVLCTEKKDAVVRYTLPEDNKQIFASKYKLYLPTEEELAKELKHQRALIEERMRLEGKVTEGE